MNGLEVTAVKIAINNENAGRLRAYASVTFNECFIVKDMKIIDGKNGTFIAMPQKKRGDEFVDIAHPLKKPVRDMIQDAIFEEYVRLGNDILA